jgi:hypothetical protein
MRLHGAVGSGIAAEFGAIIVSQKFIPITIAI